MASPGSVVFQFKAVADKAKSDVLDFAKSLGKVDSAATDTDRQLDKVSDGFDQAGDSARDAVRDVKAVDDALSRADFDALADEAQQAARRIRTASSDMADGVRSGAAGIETETSHIRDNMGETGKEAGAELIGNIAEGIGSGEAKLTDVLQGTLGGLVNMVATVGGPIGLAAGGIATGIGVIFSVMHRNAEKTREKLDEMRGALGEISDFTSKEAQKRIFEAWVSSAQETKGKLEAVRDVLKLAEVSAADFQKAIAGNPTAQKKVTDALADQYQLLLNQATTGEKLTDEQGRYMDNVEMVLGDLGANNRALQDIRREQDAINDLTGKAKGKTEDWNYQLGRAVTHSKDVKDNIDEATKDRTVKIKWDVDKLPRHLGGSVDISQSAAGVTVNMPAQTATATATVTPAPPTVIVTEEQVYRAVQRLLLRGDARNGRMVLVR